MTQHPKIAARVRSVIEPPITLFRERHRAHLADRDLIDLNQAVPSYPPPPPVTETIAAAAAGAQTHLYAPDPGLPECRAATAEWLVAQHAARVSAEEIMITPGANAAFHFAANTLLDPGDRAALLTPFYFNHAMSVELLGSLVVEIPWKGELPLEKIEHSGVRILALVTPSNPTGRTLTPSQLQEAFDWARSRGVTLVIDETYLEFPPEGVASFSALSMDGWQETAVIIGTFSKSLAMTGYRVGYLCASRDVLRQVVKVQDTAVICAPRIAQMAVTEALHWPGLPAWLAERRAEIAARVAAFTSAMAESPGLFTVECSGAFFAWLHHAPVHDEWLQARLQAFGHYRDPSPDAEHMADLLVHDARVLTLAGASAGAGGIDRIRVAVGNAEPARLREAAERIQKVRL